MNRVQSHAILGLYQLPATSRVSPSTTRAGPLKTSPAQAGHEYSNRADRSTGSAVKHLRSLLHSALEPEALHEHSI